MAERRNSVDVSRGMTFSAELRQQVIASGVCRVYNARLKNIFVCRNEPDLLVFTHKPHFEVMMSVQLDQIVSRRGTNSVKWEFQFKDGTFSHQPMGDDPLSAEQVLPLWVADMDFQSPPAVIEALCERARHGVFGYSAPTDQYFDSIINWMQHRHGWAIEKEWILTAPGVVPTLNFLVQTFTEMSDKLLIQTPVYHPFATAIENNGRELVTSSLALIDGRYQVDWDDMTAKLSDPAMRMFILCHPHNPVGRAWEADELRKIAELCKTHDVLLVSDEIHHDLIHSWTDFKTIGVACAEYMDNIIVCTAPSKTFNIPGLKTSNVFIKNEDLRGKLQAFVGKLGLFGISPFGIIGLQTAYETGEPWLNEVMEYVGANYAFMRDFLAENLPSCSVIKPDATYLAWVDMRGLGFSAEDLNAKMLNDAKVFLNNGAGFGEEGEGFMRVNLACPRAVLDEALNRIAETFG